MFGKEKQFFLLFRILLRTQFLEILRSIMFHRLLHIDQGNLYEYFFANGSVHHLAGSHQ